MKQYFINLRIALAHLLAVIGGAKPSFGMNMHEIVTVRDAQDNIVIKGMITSIYTEYHQYQSKARIVVEVVK